MDPISEETAAYIATVGHDHQVTVPLSIPAGAVVAIVVLPTAKGNGEATTENEATRQAHFAAVMKAIQSVASRPAPADQYSDEELSAIIEKARKAPVG